MQTRIASVLVVAACLCGTSCATSQSSHVPLGAAFRAKPETAEVEVFRVGAPQREFERISRLDVHLEKAGFIASSLESALPALKKQARLSGADAIIEIRESKSMVGETRVYHVTATGIRYKRPEAYNPPRVGKENRQK